MINFLKYKLIYLFISLTVIGVGLFSIARWGYRFSIDFVGGSNIQYQLKKSPSVKSLGAAMEKNNLGEAEYKINNNVLTIRTKALSEKQEISLKADLEKAVGEEPVILRYETVGPTLGRETMVKTGIASLIAIIGILIYMTFAFKGYRFAVAAIIAMIHDFLVVIGSYSLISHFFGAELDAMFVTAVLTTMSFSVHDTIVIFDKIREYMKSETGEIDLLSNRALTETMVRSINNSMTIVFMLFSLSMLGGETIRFFVIALLIGTITGTYSSPFVATPILVWLEKIKK